MSKFFLGSTLEEHTAALQTLSRVTTGSEAASALVLTVGDFLPNTWHVKAPHDLIFTIDSRPGRGGTSTIIPCEGKLPIVDNAFDAVIVDMEECDPAVSLEEYVRVAKDGAPVVFYGSTVDNAYYLARVLGNLPCDGVRVHVRIFSTLQSHMYKWKKERTEEEANHTAYVAVLAETK